MSCRWIKTILGELGSLTLVQLSLMHELDFLVIYLVLFEPEVGTHVYI